MTDQPPPDETGPAVPINKPRTTRRTDQAALDSRLYGLHAGLAALRNPARKVRRIVATENTREQVEAALADAQAAGVRGRPAPKISDRNYLDRMAPSGAVHQGLLLDVEPLKVAPLDRFLANLDDGPQILVALDQVTDPHNVGAILRSAAAFGAVGLVMTQRHAPTATGVVAKTASGAMEVVPMLRIGNLNRGIEEIKASGFKALALAEESDTAIGDAPLGGRGRWLLLLGAEGDGLRQSTREAADQVARLPTVPPINSLNVSNAAAVALYEVRRQIGPSRLRAPD